MRELCLFVALIVTAIVGVYVTHETLGAMQEPPATGEWLGMGEFEKACETGNWRRFFNHLVK